MTHKSITRRRFRVGGLILLTAAAVCAQTRPQRAAGTDVLVRAQRLITLDPDLRWTDIVPDASLKGWTRLAIPPERPLDPVSQWHVKDRVVTCDGDRGHEWLRWDRELGDFMLHVEWRFPIAAGEPKYNSGIFVRNSADGRVWHQAQAGGGDGGYLFGSTLVNGAPQRLNLRKAMTANRVRPAGEWNIFEVRCEGPKITLEVNGEVTSEFTACEVPRGYLGLEAEGYRIEFRNLRVRVLDRKVE